MTEFLNKEALENINSILAKGRKVQLEYNKKSEQLKVLELKLHLIDLEKK